MSQLSRRGQLLVDCPPLPSYIAEHFARAGQPWDPELHPDGYISLCIAENKLHNDALIAQLDRAAEPEDVQATLAELTAIELGRAIESVAPEATTVGVCGGGALNQHLMSRLQQALPGR